MPFSSITAPRKAAKKRSGKPKAKRRTKEDFARIYGSKERVAWVKAQPCVYCATYDSATAELWRGRCENAHVETGGMGRKAEYTQIVPLCPPHHRAYDEHRAPLASDFIRGVIKRAAAATERAWQNHFQRESA